MRILHLITNLGVGGAETMLMRLIKQLVASGAAQAEDHPVAYFRDGPIRQQLEALGVPTYHLSGQWSPYDTGLLIHTVSLVRRVKPDIIHSSLWLANLIARCVGWWTKTPVICDLHSNCAYHGLVRRAIDGIPLPKPAAVIAVSDGVRRSFLQSARGRHLHDRTQVIVNGVDTAQFAFSSAARAAMCLKLGCNRYIIGAVGRLVRIKRYDLLIEAFAHVVRRHDAMLCFVGDGPERPFLRRKARECGVEDRVRFVGQFTDVAPWYSVFDCLAVTSQSEGLSLAVLEALASGLPVLTTGDDGSHEVVQTNVNGIVIKTNDVPQIVDGLEQLLSSWREPTAERPSLLAVEYSICHTADAYNRLYEHVLR